MTTRRRVGLMIAAILATPAWAQTAKAPDGPESTVRALLAAMQANDAAAIRAVFAPNASQQYGSSAAKSGPAFFSWLQSDIIDAKGRVEAPQLAVQGNTVVVTGQYRNDKGYASPANFLIRVEAGKIASWQMRY